MHFLRRLRISSMVFVDRKSVSVTVSRLRAELDQIGTDNRLYFTRKSHTKDEILKHQERRDRVVEIKLELESITMRKIA